MAVQSVAKRSARRGEEWGVYGALCYTSNAYRSLGCRRLWWNSPQHFHALSGERRPLAEEGTEPKDTSNVYITDARPVTHFTRTQVSLKYTPRATDSRFKQGGSASSSLEETGASPCRPAADGLRVSRQTMQRSSVWPNNANKTFSRCKKVQVIRRRGTDRLLIPITVQEQTTLAIKTGGKWRRCKYSSD